MTAPQDRCVYCDHVLAGHGVRYSDQIGNHTFTRESPTYIRPPQTIPATPR